MPVMGPVILNPASMPFTPLVPLSGPAPVPMAPVGKAASGCCAQKMIRIGRYLRTFFKTLFLVHFQKVFILLF